MSEEDMIQYLYDQIDRLISMQNTMLTVVGALFAIIIGVFAFFQWRINQRDQSIIIKTVKEEIIETLIRSYNLLGINENGERINQLKEANRRILDQQHEKNMEFINEHLDLKLLINNQKNVLQFYLLFEQHILLAIEDNDYIDNQKRDEILDQLIKFRHYEKDDDLRKSISDTIFQLLNVYSEEKLDKSILDMAFNDELKETTNI